MVWASLFSVDRIMSPADRDYRCAIYTRKSSEEGLEQSFNSLDAQRDACQAYIKSQSHEGWVEIGGRYDDGGFSGGNIERPALQNLLADVKDGKVDIIVVYKIDRLTRSLADFAKIVDTLDRHNASFVAVTQQFNTTSSMGRLTLNVLLSFAQFEREVAGERIRDKISASKRRGMWMGGHPPLGYDAEARTLRINEGEAELVRSIFHEYLNCKTVPNLRVRLRTLGIKSKKWRATSGVEHGGSDYSRGALYYLLRNQIYIGRITHKKDAYPGNHPAIISDELWTKVQSQLDENRSTQKRKPNAGARHPLAGLLYDDCGNLMSPSYTQRPNGRRYRYYISQAVLQNNNAAAGSLARIPAPLIEGLVARRTKHLLVQDDHWSPNPKPNRLSLRELIDRVVVGREKVEIYLRNHRPAIVTAGMIVKEGRGSIFTEFGSAASRTYGGPATSLVKALCRAWNWVERCEKGEVSSYHQLARLEGLSPPYVRSVMRLAFLAPDLVEAIGGGITKFLERELPMSWVEQRKLLLKEHPFSSAFEGG
jgi:site-specific DNA recombinase